MESIDSKEPKINDQQEFDFYKEYEITLDSDNYRLILETLSKEEILFKLRNTKNIAYVFYLKKYKYNDIIEELNLENEKYNNIKSICDLFDELLSMKKIKLVNCETEKKIKLCFEKDESFEKDCFIDLERETISNRVNFMNILGNIKSFNNINLINLVNELNNIMYLENNAKEEESEEKEENKENEENLLKKLTEIKNEIKRRMKFNLNKKQGPKNDKIIQEKKNEINVIYKNSGIFSINEIFHENFIKFNELDETNVDLFIQGVKYEFNCKEFINKKKNSFLFIKILFKKNINDCSFMFYQSKQLFYIDLSSFESKNVKKMGNMFSGCENLIDINLSSLDTSNVEIMDSMFYNCKMLEKVDLSSFNTSKVNDMSEMFYGCSNLIIVSLFISENVKYISNMFCKCNSLVNVDLSYFKGENLIGINNLFSSCRNLINIDLSSLTGQNLEKIETLFERCNSLVNINLSSLKGTKLENMNNFFIECNNLMHVDLSSLIVNSHQVEKMFYLCFSLNKVKINRKSLEDFQSIIDDEIIEVID